MLSTHRKCLEENRYQTVIVIFGDWRVAKRYGGQSLFIYLFIYFKNIYLFGCAGS